MDISTRYLYEVDSRCVRRRDQLAPLSRENLLGVNLPPRRIIEGQGQRLLNYSYNPGLIDLAGMPMPLVVRLDDGSPNLSPIANACY